MSVEFRHYTDPSCERSWAAEPQMRRLLWEFGDSLRPRPVMGGLSRRLEPADHAERLAAWLEAAAESGMPCDPRLWTANPISSSYPACQAVRAACEQGASAGMRYLRRLREGLLCERRRLDHVDALLAEAGPAGLDRERFAIDLRSNAIVEAFGSDLELRRAAPGGPLPLPSYEFVSASGKSRLLAGPQGYDSLRAAAIDAGAEPAGPDRPDPLAAVERLGRCATAELAELSGRPRPVLEAELWQLARDWRLRPVTVLTGTLWELP